MACSPDGTRLATASHDKTARIWDAHTGEPHTTLTGHTSSVDAVAYSPDGTHLATACRDAPLASGTPHTGDHRATLTGHTDRVRSAVACSPDGTRLATAARDNTARIWDAAHRRTPHHPHRPHQIRRRRWPSPPTAPTWPPPPTTAPPASGIRYTGELRTTLTGHTGPIQGVAYSPDGTHLATASHDNTARIWDAPPANTAPPSPATPTGFKGWPAPPTAPTWPPPPSTTPPASGTPPPAARSPSSSG